MDDVPVIIKRLQNQGCKIELEHSRCEGGETIVVATEDFLYPQYDHRVESLKQQNKIWLQRVARKLQANTDVAAPEVSARWESIIDGTFFEKK